MAFRLGVAYEQTMPLKEGLLPLTLDIDNNAASRDTRWQRTATAYDAMVWGRAPRHAASAAEAVRTAYEAGVGDEFIE